MTGSRNQPILSVLVAVGAVGLFVGAILSVASRGLFDPKRFGDHLGQSLRHPGVAAYVAEGLTQAAIKASPDLIAARPLVLATASGLVATRPFQAIAAVAGERAHRALFAQRTRNVVLSLPDLGVLLRNALAQASPALAAKVPKRAETVLASLGEGKPSQILLSVWRIGSRLRWITGMLLFLAPVCFLTAIGIASHRHLTILRVSVALAVVGLLFLALVPLGRLAVSLLIAPELARGLAAGLWQTYMGEAWTWGLLLTGLGILGAAGSTALLESLNPLAILAGARGWLVHPPPERWRRWIWAFTLLAGGLLLAVFPRESAAGMAFLAGAFLAFWAICEMFQLILDQVDRTSVVASLGDERRWVLHVLVVMSLLVLAGGAWAVWRQPAQTAAASSIAACNGLPELCDRRVDEVVFPGAHNAMSNQDIPEWLFPHHQASMPRQLQDGIRALLVDIHYGFPGASRVKTDLDVDKGREKLIEVLGKEGFDAAMRVRNRLVGVDEGKRGLYFCHGFCEIGAYPVGPTLDEIHSFLVSHPDEVLLLIIEDHVTPQDLARAFDAAELTGMVFTGSTRDGWPTLRRLIDDNQRLIVFIESGRPGVEWLRPAFETIQETPYSFHKPDEMSCVANRGGTSGSLFLLNHWIETTPTPKPSNAAIVNAPEFLLARATRCAQERDHITNVIAVDFVRSGDVVGVTRTLNQRGATTPVSTAPPGSPVPDRVPGGTTAVP
jgi:hypothetical protein